MRRITRITIRISSPLLLLLLVTLLAPIIRYTFGIATISIIYRVEIIRNNSTRSQKEPVGDAYLDNSTGSVVHSGGERFGKVRQPHVSVFQDDNSIKNVTSKPQEADDGGNKSTEHTMLDIEAETEQEALKVGNPEFAKNKSKKPDEHVLTDHRVRYLKDQLIRGRIYLSLSATRSHAYFVRELRFRMKEVQKALGDATKDVDLPNNANDKLKTMDQTLAKGKQIHDDCTAVVRKLRAIIHSAEEQLRVHQNQAVFLTHLTAKTIPEGLHCLPLRLSTEYYSLNSSAQQFPNQDNLDDPNLFHYALFSDNLLDTAVVVNSTVTNAKNHERLLWKLGTLPPGLITFWKRVYTLENSWHVVGLGYNLNVSKK